MRSTAQDARIGLSRTMCARDFARFGEFIHAECGIKMPPGKKTMLEARLQKRLRALGLDDYGSYCEYLFSTAGMETEIVHLLDVVTTNTTDFFREPRHFELLLHTLLPRWSIRHGGSRVFRIWSAFCSTGEEPYTMAMVLSDFASRTQGFTFSILGTDISTRVLEHARRAIYSTDKIKPVSESYRKRFLLRSKDRSRELVRIAPEVRRLVDFKRLNFMESISLETPMDMIFCRNVMIYFERATQEELLRKLCTNLRLGGHLFIGHSESLTGLTLPLKQIAPTVYERE